MSSHTEKALVLAEKVKSSAESALHDLDREMAIMDWPTEFRAIMWGAVADIAARRRDEAEGRK